MPVLTASVYMTLEKTGVCKKRGLPSCFALLEESRKLWDELITDKFIYFEKVSNREQQPLSFISKLNFNSRFWLEFHILSHEAKGYFHDTAIVECFLYDGSISRYF